MPAQRSRHRQVSIPPYFSIARTTVQGLGDDFDQEEEQAHQIQLRFTRRSTNKRFKGSQKPVWPPRLEAAFLQGLFKYARMEAERRTDLHHEINRNAFISNHILETTNETRTVKQVSSRIQQLRSSCARNTKDTRLLNLIDHVPLRIHEIELLALGPRPLLREGAKPELNIHRPTHTRVVISSFSAHAPSPIPEIPLVDASERFISLCTVPEFQPYTHLRCGMDPMVVLISPFPLGLLSRFDIFRDDKPYVSFEAQLVPVGMHEGGLYRYTASIADGHWGVVSLYSRRHNGGRIECKIVQLIYHERPGYNLGYPIAEVEYVFEPAYLSPAPPVNNGPRSEPLEQFQYEPCPPSPPRPKPASTLKKSAFFPGTPSPSPSPFPQPEPEIVFTFIEEKFDSIMPRRKTEKSNRELRVAEQYEKQESVRSNIFYSRSGMVESNLLPVQLYSIQDEMRHINVYDVYDEHGFFTLQTYDPAAYSYDSYTGESLGHYPAAHY
ncbi:hypothetical protein FB45DRAFT_859298 [Roridomyces roridus]|uniref:TEA domain-containing protein n=1 Tax=Roridomyces roridus TaxID=1738132 RepID=A0AAD7G198_9AGAR|nr:hypothetical protein FB45DRAFT_859298 [Roridomyces roridus]